MFVQVKICTRALLIMIKTLREVALIEGDLWHAFDKMIAASTESELIQIIIELWEEGNPNPAFVKSQCTQKFNEVFAVYLFFTFCI